METVTIRVDKARESRPAEMLLLNHFVGWCIRQGLINIGGRGWVDNIPQICDAYMADYEYESGSGASES